MNFNKNNQLYLLVFLIILSSCSIQKRQYLSGYYIDWIYSKNKSEQIIKNQTPLSKIETFDSIDSTYFATEIYSESEYIYASNNENIRDINPIVNYKQIITENSYNIDLHYKKTTKDIPDKKEKNYGKTSMFLAILNFFLCLSIVIPIVFLIDYLIIYYFLLLPFISIAISLLGIFYGIRELNEDSSNSQNKVMAVVGIVVNLIPMIFFLMYLVFIFIAITAIGLSN
jgi:hypothetical protein